MELTPEVEKAAKKIYSPNNTPWILLFCAIMVIGFIFLFTQQYVNFFIAFGLNIALGWMLNFKRARDRKKFQELLENQAKLTDSQ